MTHANPLDSTQLQQGESSSTIEVSDAPAFAAGEAPSGKLGRFDHVAIEVDAFDVVVESLIGSGALRMIRTGTMRRSGRRIAMLGDGTGVKIEVIESDEAATPRLAHVAFRSADIADSVRHLESKGWRVLFGPHPLDAAHAETALLQSGQHLNLQVISYENTSPDIVEWSGAQSGGR